MAIVIVVHTPQKCEVELERKSELLQLLKKELLQHLAGVVD
jgi:hypothetical protein